MLSRFQLRRQKRRGPSEDPAAPFRATRRDVGSSSELIDFALIDATVNEWMADVEKEQAASRSKDTGQRQLSTGSSRSGGTSSPHPEGSVNASARTLSSTSPGPKKSMRRLDWARGNRDTIGTPALHPRSKRAAGKPDRVLAAAIDQRLVTESELTDWMTAHEQETLPEWRTVCRWAPDRAQAFERLAAEVYGFRPVLICQMSTLVLADLLTMRIPDHFWRPMMEAGVIPVVEHGTHPDPAERVLCVSHDPSNRLVRTLLDDIKAFSPELAYSDKHNIRAMMELMSQHVPTIGAQVYTTRPALKRIESSTSSGKAA